MAEIDLVRSELAALVQKVVAEEMGGVGRWPEQPFGLYVFGCDEEGSELGRWVERTVFYEAFGDTPALLREEYGRYEESSLFFCLVDHNRRIPAGVMRIILPSPAGFKSVVDLERMWDERPEEVLERSAAYLDLDRTWDIATLAVAPEYRGRATSGLVTLGLYQGLGTLSRLEGINFYVTVLDVIVLRHVQWQLKKGFSTYAGIEPRQYLGSPLSAPAWCDIVGWRQRLLVGHEELHDLLFRGSGLEAAVRLPRSLADRAMGLPVAAV